jgi:hypothetical protein
MAVLPTTTFQQPDDEWFKSVNGGTLPHHNVVFTPTPIPIYDNNSVTYKEYVIKGEMLSVQKAYSASDYFELESVWGTKTPEMIKRQLVELMVEELYNNKCITFMTQQDNATLARCFRARIFATPDNQTRIVKELLDKKAKL